MYFTNRRYNDRLYLTGVGVRTSVVNFAYSTPCLLEGIYSWRTGRNLVSDPPITPPVRGANDGWGIRTPSNRGNLVDRLADRKRYIEEFSRTVSPAETASGATSVDRASTTDTGHLFASHKTLRKPFVARLHTYSGPTAYYDGDIWAAPDRNVYNPSPYTFGFGYENRVNALGVTTANRQGMANRYFTATAPDRQVGTVGVTLLELLRGDIPSVLKNYHSMMQGYKSIRNQLGSDYLNIVFGWTPLIQEYANVVKVGMTLERVVYYESYRRKRAWEGPSSRTSTDYVQNLNSSGLVYSTLGTYQLPGEVVAPAGGFGMNFNATQETVIHEDYRFSSRYTGLAKAGRKAESMSEVALDVMTRLGVVDDPTLLWDLTPWSWLVDWFTTMGDSISNASLYSPISGKYNVDFAYLTTKYTQSSTATLLRGATNLPSGDRVWVNRPVSMTTSVTKWRDRATPFGFGTQLGSLNASQFAILVALGLAKSR